MGNEEKKNSNISNTEDAPNANNVSLESSNVISYSPFKVLIFIIFLIFDIIIMYFLSSVWDQRGFDLIGTISFCIVLFLGFVLPTSVFLYAERNAPSRCCLTWDDDNSIPEKDDEVK